MSCHVCLLDFTAPSVPPSQGQGFSLAVGTRHFWKFIKNNSVVKQNR